MPGPETLAAKLPLIRRTGAFTAPHRAQLAIAAIFLILQTLLTLVPVWIFRDLVNRLAEHGTDFSAVAWLVAGGFGAIVLAGLCGVVATTLTAATGESIVSELRERLVDRFLLQPVAYFTARRSGEITSNLLNDIDAVDNVLSTTLMTIVRTGALLCGLLVVMFVMDWQLALLTLLVLPLIFVPARLASRAAYRTRAAVQEQLSEMTAYLQETLSISGVMLVKAFARGRAERETFAQINRELRRREVRAALATRWFTMLLGVLQTAGPTLLLLIGGLLITHGRSAVGTVLAFSTVIVGQLAGNVQGLGSALLEVVGSLAAWERIFTVLDLEPELADRPGARPLQNPEGSIRFSDVSYGYAGTSRRALDAVSAELLPGQMTALVGPSGAGKTTFSSLISRVADPSAGGVSIDGHDLRDCTLESVQAAVGVVFQDAFLFHTTLRENLRYGRPDAGDAEIQRVAAEMHLGEVIERLPDGLDTVVGERGHRLSGGEKQRVALARVLLKDPKILVLDEATAHLDTASERLVQEALGRLLVGRTSLVIAHRLSTVIAADQILVLDAGHIVARGRHEQLLRDGGLYATLYREALIRPTPTDAHVPQTPPPAGTEMSILRPAT